MVTALRWGLGRLQTRWSNETLYVSHCSIYFCVYDHAVMWLPRKSYPTPKQAIGYHRMDIQYFYSKHFVLGAGAREATAARRGTARTAWRISEDVYIQAHRHWQLASVPSLPGYQSAHVIARSWQLGFVEFWDILPYTGILRVDRLDLIFPRSAHCPNG